MADSRLSSRPLAFNLIAQCLFLLSLCVWSRRDGIEPPHVRDVMGRRFRFCYCTRYMCASRLDYQPVLMPAVFSGTALCGPAI